MDQTQAIAEAQAIIGPSAAALLTGTDWTLAAGKAPTATDAKGAAVFDPWLVAAEAADLLGIRSQGNGGVTKYTSEGTTIERSTAQWFDMAASLRAKAASYQQQAAVGVVHIATGGPGYLPASAAQGDGYWTWDGTDPVWWPWVSPELP